MSGSKNSTLALMTAALLADGVSVLENAPRLRDVDAMLELLRALGARADWDEDEAKPGQGPRTLRIDVRGVDAFEAVHIGRTRLDLVEPLEGEVDGVDVAEPHVAQECRGEVGRQAVGRERRLL